MIGPSLAARLRDLARRVADLRLDRHDPEAFFLERSALAAELHHLATHPDAAPRASRLVRRDG